MRGLVLLLVALSLYGAWNWWVSEREVDVPPGVVAPADPAQENLDRAPTFVAKDHTLLARARYDITARVLRKAFYRVDGGTDLAPVDLGLGWGPMSDTRIVGQLEFSQMGRFLYWKPRDRTTFPLSAQDTITHAAQVHAIPASAEVERRLRHLRPGQVVTLSGYLVDVLGANGFRWTTSLRRDDTGDGACEIMWIERVAVD